MEIPRVQVKECSRVLKGMKDGLSTFRSGTSLSATPGADHSSTCGNCVQSCGGVSHPGVVHSALKR